ncbi:MAG: SRPBCC family protein [Calditrichia bacterium]
MRIRITTTVEQSVSEVFSGFTEELFLALNPPGIPVELLRFDGCIKGDEVHLKLKFPGFPQLWVSEIVDSGNSDDEIYFIDEGRTLPFFLSYWRHQHRIVRKGSGSTIIDDITFRGKFPFVSILLYPALYLQFLYRKPVYGRLFKKNK